SRGRAKTRAILGCVWNLLKIGIRAAHTPARRSQLPKVGVYPASDRVDVFEQAKPVTREQFLNAAILEKFFYRRMLGCHRLKLPTASAFDLDSHIRQRINHLCRAIEVDVGWLAEECELRHAGREFSPQFVGQNRVRAFETDHELTPAFRVERHSGKLHRGEREDAVELEPCDLFQPEFVEFRRELFIEWQHQGRVFRSVFVLSIAKRARPATDLKRFVDKLIQVPLGYRSESVTAFASARADQLACKQRVEYPAHFQTEMMKQHL